MTRAQNVKMLTELGFPKAIAEKMSANIPTDAPETPEDEITTNVEAVISHQRELYTNSDDYKTTLKGINDAKLAEVSKKFEKKIIALAQLTADEVKDKKADEILELAWSKAAKMGDKTAEEIQKELIKKDEQLKDLLENEIPKIKADVQLQINSFKSESALMKSLGGLKLRKGIAQDDALEMIKIKANKMGYKASLNEKGELVYTNADGSKIMTEDKKGFLDTNSIVGRFLEGFVEKSNADEPEPGKKTTVIVPEGTKKEKNQGEAVNAASTKAEMHAQKLAQEAASKS
jgi:hypothetical protein